MKIIGSKKNKEELLKMLAWIEVCGNIGHTCQYFKVGVDGDGSGRMNFEFDNEDEKTEYRRIKDKVLEEFKTTKKDLQEISIE